jgi:hypothetical protein
VVNVGTVFVKIIEAQFILNPQKHQHGCRNAESQSADVDAGIYPVTKKGPEGKPEVVKKHSDTN